MRAGQHVSLVRSSITVVVASPRVDEERRRAYWRKNLQYVGVLLTIWFLASYGCGILFADQLDAITLGGFPLGFWFAQQGAIYIFVALIFVYVWLMNRLDRRFGVDDTDDSEDDAR